jgi:hypothetical protein
MQRSEMVHGCEVPNSRNFTMDVTKSFILAATFNVKGVIVDEANILVVRTSDSDLDLPLSFSL